MLKLLAAGLAICAAAAPAFAAEKEAITPGGMEWAKKIGFSPALRVGDYVYLSGIVAGVPPSKRGANGEISEDTLIAAYDRAFVEIGKVLAAAGASYDDIVDMTTFHTDLQAQKNAFMTVKNRYIKEPLPAWTAIGIDRLWGDTGITEIKITAYAPKKKTP